MKTEIIKNMNSARDGIDKILFSKEEIQLRVEELGRQITKDLAEEDLVVVGILKGAGIFMCDLIREIDMPVRIDFMTVSSYGNAKESSGEIRIIKDLQQDVRGSVVLLVEDIVETGLTLSCLKEIMAERGAKDVRICTLLDKPEKRKKEVKTDYCGFTVGDTFIVGYGIDYAEHYRNLPYIAALKQD